jgi:hypothetical protein
LVFISNRLFFRHEHGQAILAPEDPEEEDELAWEILNPEDEFEYFNTSAIPCTGRKQPNERGKIEMTPDGSSTVMGGAIIGLDNSHDWEKTLTPVTVWYTGEAKIDEFFDVEIKLYAHNGQNYEERHMVPRKIKRVQ